MTCHYIAWHNLGHSKLQWNREQGCTTFSLHWRIEDHGSFLWTECSNGFEIHVCMLNMGTVHCLDRVWMSRQTCLRKAGLVLTDSECCYKWWQTGTSHSHDSQGQKCNNMGHCINARYLWRLSSFSSAWHSGIYKVCAWWIVDHWRKCAEKQGDRVEKWYTCNLPSSSVETFCITFTLQCYSLSALH
jgi:hypothetical protein